LAAWLGTVIVRRGSGRNEKRFMPLTRSSHSSLLAASLGLGAWSFACYARASPIKAEIGAKIGYGTSPINTRLPCPPSSTALSALASPCNVPNPLGFGLGARAGVSFLGLYGGLAFTYYFGSSQSASVSGTSGSLSDHALMYGVEAGYGLTFLIVTVRPQLGIGNFTMTTDASGALVGSLGVSSSQSRSNVYFEPGVTGVIALGGWFVGADANVLVLPGMNQTNPAFTIHGQAGLVF
jgi:hypothetical protein